MPDYALDTKDRRILYQLSRNARLAQKQLASRIRLSQSATARRLNKLREENVLLGSHPIIDNAKLGYIGFRTYCTFTGTTPEEERTVYHWLENNDTVSVLAASDGSADIVIMSWVEDKYEYEAFLNTFKQRYRSLLGPVRTHQYLGVHTYSRDYLVEEQDEYRLTIGRGSAEEYDAMDKAIIKELLEDARRPVTEIARELDEPARTVTDRLRRLERTGIIAGYGINLNIRKIGYSYYKINIVTDDNYDPDTLLSYADSLSQTVYVDNTLSPYDFELNVEVEGRDGYFSIVENLKELIGGARTIDVFEVKRYEKLTFVSF